ncbi:hypothetical protein [Actinotignum sp. GS-2025d]|uniref:hypothetical protein n=1 Tax=Actinotignum sp. GS-2025d TaxID=3427277 RepID=UPI003F44654F
MSTNPFVAPAAPGDGIVWREVNGALLIIKPTQHETGFKTTYGESDVIHADIWVLDGPTAGESFEDTLIFPRMLVNQLKNQIGELVIGRVSQGQAKPGQSAPWLLQAASEQETQFGAQCWERIQASRFQAPEPPQAPAAPQAQGGWGNPAPAQPQAPQAPQAPAAPQGWAAPAPQAPAAPAAPASVTPPGGFDNALPF